MRYTKKSTFGQRFIDKLSSVIFGKTISILLLFLTILAIPFITLFIKNHTQYQSHAAGISDSNTYNYAISLIQRSGDKLITSDPLNHLNPTYLYNSLGYDCSALLEASNKLKSIDPTRSNNFKTYGLSIADYVVTHKDDNHNGLVGWGLTYAWDAFQDGTVNPPNTEYAYQTPVVGYCLLDAYIASNNVTYLQTVKDAITAFTNASTTTTFSDPFCSNCFYYGYSLNNHDAGRLVKNTNMLMAGNVARISKITGNGTYAAKAQQLFNTEQYEIIRRKNFNYLGYKDPHYNPNHKGAHIVYEMWGVEDLGKNVSGLAYLNTLESLESAFWSCGATCSANISTEHGMVAACLLAQEDAFSKNQCASAISLYSSPTVSSTVTAYPMISVVKSLDAFSGTSS